MTVKEYITLHGNIIPPVTWFDSAPANVIFSVNYGALDLAIDEGDVEPFVAAFNLMFGEKYSKYKALSDLPFGVDKTTTVNERTLKRTGDDRTTRAGSDTTQVDYGRTNTVARTGTDTNTTNDTSTVTTDYNNLANLHKSRGFNADELTPDTEDTQSGSVTATNGGGVTATFEAGTTDTNTSGGSDTSTLTRNTTDTLTHDTTDTEKSTVTVTRDYSAEEHFDKQREQMQMVIMQTYIHDLASALLVYVW